VKSGVVYKSGLSGLTPEEKAELERKAQEELVSL